MTTSLYTIGIRLRELKGANQAKQKYCKKSNYLKPKNPSVLRNF